MSVFHGNWNEDAEAFLNSYLERMGSLDDEKRARSFIYYLQADSDADEWFEELPEEEKKSWASIEVLFRRKWLKQEDIGTKEVKTIENGPQELFNSPEITQKHIFSLCKPSETPTLPYMTYNTPMEAKTTIIQHSELVHATATSPKAFSPPAPSPSPKPPEIGPTQPFPSYKLPEMNSPTHAATSQSPEPFGSGKNSKIHPTAKISMNFSNFFRQHHIWPP